MYLLLLNISFSGGYLIELLDSKGSLLHDLTGGFKGEEQKNVKKNKFHSIKNN